MTSDTPPHPRSDDRRDAIVPVDATHATEGTAVPRALPRLGTNPLADLPTAREYPHLVRAPLPQWSDPEVHSTWHPTATSPTRPDDRAVPTDASAFDLQQDRVRSVLSRERRMILAGAAAPAVADPPVAAPFPLPADATPRAGTRRTPKARRPDASGRPLTADVAAAIARLAAHAESAEDAAATTVPGGRARDRITIIPLGEPADLSTFPPPPSPRRRPRTIDLRERKRERKRAKVEHQCPACAKPGVVDLIDHITGEVHVSCPRCFRMWNATIAPATSAHEAR